MKIELFVLPQKTRADFMEAFVLAREEWDFLYPNVVSPFADDAGRYDGAYLWEKMSIPAVTIREALKLLRSHEGTVLFLSEPEMSGNPGELYLYGREIYDFVAMADAHELADRIEYEWFENWRLTLKGDCLPDSILPDDLYVFDTTFEWVIVFTHENDPDYDGKSEGAESRYCKAFGV